MSTGPLKRTFIVRNEQGLHMRPAKTLSKVASQFESSISISKGGEFFDCKSMLSLMTLGATQGTELTVKAEGSDAPAALVAIEELFARGFDESSQTDAEAVDS